MKTLTVTISDEAAQKLADHAAQNGQSSEQWAARVVEEAVEDWGDLSEADIAAIEAGLQDLERGEMIPHDQVVAEMKQKYGW